MTYSMTFSPINKQTNYSVAIFIASLSMGKNRVNKGQNQFILMTPQRRKEIIVFILSRQIELEFKEKKRKTVKEKEFACSRRHWPLNCPL